MAGARDKKLRQLLAVLQLVPEGIENSMPMGHVFTNEILGLITDKYSVAGAVITAPQPLKRPGYAAVGAAYGQ